MHGRVAWVPALAIAGAAAQLALLLLVVAGRLAPQFAADDAAWLAIWVGYAVCGALVLERRPRSHVGVLLCLIGALPAVATLVDATGGPERVGAASYAVLPPLLLVGLPAVFPDGVAGSRLRRIGVASTWVLATTAGAGVLLLGESAAGPVLLVSATLGVGALTALALRVRDVREPERTQRRIFLFGFGSTASILAVGALAVVVAPVSARLRTPAGRPPAQGRRGYTRRDLEAVDRMAEVLAVRLERRDLQVELAGAQRALAQSRDKEQARWRSALHDDVGPLLVGAEMQARALLDLDVEEEWRPRAELLHASLAEARVALRTVLDEGSPRALARGLGPALAELCERWPQPRVTFGGDPEPELSAAVAGAAYRLVAEALANVTQHAHASTCHVSLASVGSQLEVAIEDDGVGIGADAPHGVGLGSMRGRALELGGDVSVVRLPRGTRVVGRFAVAEATR